MRVAVWMAPLMLAAQVQAAEPPVPLEERIQRLERMMESDALVDMLGRIDAQQTELQQMRGQLEELQYQLDQVKQRQRELYLDTDRRLLRIEREGGQPGSAAPLQTTPLSSPSEPTGPVVPPPAAAAPAPAPVQPDATAEAAGPTPAELAAEREAYQRSFDILRNLRYVQAIAAFEEFLAKYPSGRYAHIAQYWLGEANYADRKFDQAIAAYRALVDRHPSSPKVAEALLKIGYSYNELGKPAAARPILEQLIRKYPGTTEAGQAENLLKRLRQQGG